MLAEKRVIKEGYEKVVEILETAINEIEILRNREIDEAIQEIETKYATRLEDYKTDLSRYLHIEYIEVEDETAEAEEVGNFNEVA
jgi:guanylate kinase